jgi:hypothetical protein
MRKAFFLIQLLLIFSLHAKKAPLGPYLETTSDRKVDSPWLTGPLLAPSGLTIPKGHYNIEPYVYVFANTARYNKGYRPVKIPTYWSVVIQPSIQIGLTDFLDFQFNPTCLYNYTRGAAKWDVGDMPIGIDIQLYKSDEEIADWITGLKLAIKEVLPLGRYQKLNPKKFRTDLGGVGSWQTTIGLVWGNLIYLKRDHFLSLRLNAQYTFPTQVHVKNFNAYGGGPGTRGKVRPPQNFEIDLGSELTLTRNWVFAMDAVALWQTPFRFKGRTFLPNSGPSSFQLSLAPAIEYNWNADLGIIAGPWFTIAGRNSLKFTSGVIAFNYYH